MQFRNWQKSPSRTRFSEPETYRNSVKLGGRFMDDPRGLATYLKGPRGTPRVVQVVALPPQAAAPPPGRNPSRPTRRRRLARRRRHHHRHRVVDPISSTSPPPLLDQEGGDVIKLNVCTSRRRRTLRR